MPKVRFNRDTVLDAALDLVREEGFESLSARKIAERAECSVQPIYSQFGGMDGLMEALYAHGIAWVSRFNAERSCEAPNSFAGNGRSHIYLAQEEPLLFAFLYQSPYMKTGSLEDVFAMGSQPGVLDEVSRLGNLAPEQAHELYLHMIIYTHGLASLIAGGAQLPIEQISTSMNEAFSAFFQAAAQKEIDK